MSYQDFKNPATMHMRLGTEVVSLTTYNHLLAELKRVEEERDKDVERAQRAGNNLYLAIVHNAVPFFPEDSPDLEWDLLPFTIGAKLKVLKDLRSAHKVLCEEREAFQKFVDTLPKDKERPTLVGPIQVAKWFIQTFMDLHRKAHDALVEAIKAERAAFDRAMISEQEVGIQKAVAENCDMRCRKASTAALRAEKKEEALKEKIRRIHDAYYSAMPGDYSIDRYLVKQFPATEGHIPLAKWFSNMENVIKSNPNEK